MYEKKEEKNEEIQPQKKLIESTIKKKKFSMHQIKHIEFLLQRSVNLSESDVKNFTIIIEVANGGN